MKNKYKKWTKHEDKLVLEHYVFDLHLASMLGRSIESVQARRSRLKKDLSKALNQSADEEMESLKGKSR